MVARALLIKGLEGKVRVLCAREFQTSIADSVHKLLSEQIEALGLAPYYEGQKTRIIGLNGTEFIFKGLAPQRAGDQVYGRRRLLLD